MATENIDQDRERRFLRRVQQKAINWNHVKMCSEFGEWSIASAREMAAEDVYARIFERGLGAFKEVIAELREEYVKESTRFLREMRTMIWGSQAWREYPECVEVFEAMEAHYNYYNAFAMIELDHIVRDFNRLTS